MMIGQCLITASACTEKYDGQNMPIIHHLDRTFLIGNVAAQGY